MKIWIVWNDCYPEGTFFCAAFSTWKFADKYRLKLLLQERQQWQNHVNLIAEGIKRGKIDPKDDFYKPGKFKSYLKLSVKPNELNPELPDLDLRSVTEGWD